MNNNEMSGMANLKEENKNRINKKMENDKSLIEFLTGKSFNDSPKKDKKSHDKLKKKVKNIRMNLHNKRKKIKFNMLIIIWIILMIKIMGKKIQKLILIIFQIKIIKFRIKKYKVFVINNF